MGDQDCLKNAQTMFEEFIAPISKSVDPNLRNIVYYYGNNHSLYQCRVYMLETVYFCYRYPANWRRSMASAMGYVHERNRCAGKN